MVRQTAEFLFSPILSLFSPRFYRELLKKSLGQGFLYLIYLATICTAVFMTVVLLKWVPIAENFVDWFARKLPTMTFDKNGVTSPAKQPYEMKHPTFGMILILDTAKENIDSAEIKKAFFYITKTKIYTSDPVRNETRIFDLSAPANQPKQPEGRETLTGESVRRFYFKTKPFFLTVLFFMAMVFVFSWKVGTALFYSLVASILNQFREEKFSYAVLLNVSMFALTAVTTLQSFSLIAPALHLTPPLWMALVITSLYLGLAILIVSPPEKTSEISSS